MAGPACAVELRFTPEDGRRVRDEQYHPSQSEELLADGCVLVRFRVGITGELIRWVLRWAGGCTVLAPAELRARVAEAGGADSGGAHGRGGNRGWRGRGAMTRSGGR